LSRLHRTANSAMMATLISHVLCCGLPTVVNMLALFAGIGTLSALIPWVGLLHGVLHEFELVLLLVSALALGFGFFVHHLAAKLDCATQSCNHSPCAPKKRQSRIILIVASGLFLINLVNYFWHQAG